MTYGSGLDLIRQIFSIDIVEPFLYNATWELTYFNRGRRSTENIIIEKDPDTIFANLKFYEYGGRRLEIASTRMRRSPPTPSREIEILLHRPIHAMKQRTIIMCYEEPYRTRPEGRWKDRIKLLFNEPHYLFTIRLRRCNTYFYVTPPPKLRLDFMHEESLQGLRPDEDYRIHYEPNPQGREAGRRNALFIRIEEKAFLKLLTLKVVEMLEERGYRVEQLNPPILKKDGEDIPEEETREVIEKASEEARRELKVDVNVRIRLPSALKWWFRFVWVVGLISIFASTDIKVSGAVAALIITTRSWLFYEEEIMKLAGFWFLAELIGNLVNIFLIALGSLGILPQFGYGICGWLLSVLSSLGGLDP